MITLMCLTMASEGFGQYSGGNNDGATTAPFSGLACGALQGSLVHNGGSLDGAARAMLDQSSCSMVMFDFIFAGGTTDGMARSSIEQLECPPPMIDMFFAGGANDGSAMAPLSQTICPVPSTEEIFQGGQSDGNATASVEQNSCNVPIVEEIFTGGQNDGSSNGLVEQNACTQDQPLEIWQGGLRDGTAKGVNEQTLCFGITPLPIELMSWQAQCDRGFVQLRWTTSTEHNNAYFSLERSSDNMDWEEFARVEGMGNSSSARQYEHYDERPLRTLSYYRLSQVDHDGTRTEYSSVWVDCSHEEPRLVVYPNPNRGTFSVELLGDLSIEELLVHTSSGKLIRSFDPRGQLVQMDMSDQPSGVYFISALTQQGVSQQKVVIER